MDQFLSQMLTRYFEMHPRPRLLVDSQTGKLLRANQPAAALLGGTMPEWADRPFADWTAALGVNDFPLEQWHALVAQLAGESSAECTVTAVLPAGRSEADQGEHSQAGGPPTVQFEFQLEGMPGDATAPVMVDVRPITADDTPQDDAPSEDVPAEDAPQPESAAAAPPIGAGTETAGTEDDSETEDARRARIRRLGEQFSELSEHVPGLLYQTRGRPDGREFEVPYISGRSIEYIGWSPEEIYERPLRLLESIHPQDQPLYYQKAVESMRSGLPFQVELRMVSRTGEIRWMRCTSRSRTLPDGDLIYSGVAIDITERKNIEEAIRTSHDEKDRQVQLRTNELTRSNHELQYEIAQRKKMEEWVGDLQTQIAQASRLSIMGEMAAGFAHEVHQPLAVIANYAHGILRRLDSNQLDEESLREVVKSIAAEAMRTGEIVRRIRQFITNRETTRELLDIGMIARDAVELVKSHCQNRKVTARLELGPELAQVHGNRLQLTQVMVNLLLNGIDAMQDVAEEPKSITMRIGQTSPQMLEVSVADKGPGISPQMHQKVFEQFFTTKRDGLGMGLSVSRSLVETHGGRMWLESAPGEGSTISFTLPAVERPKPESASGPGGLARAAAVPTGLT